MNNSDKRYLTKEEVDRMNHQFKKLGLKKSHIAVNFLKTTPPLFSRTLSRERMLSIEEIAALKGALQIH